MCVILNWIRCVVFVVCCRYEIGEALYIGWASGVLAICGGACLMFSCKLGSKEKTWVALLLLFTHTHIILSNNILPILAWIFVCLTFCILQRLPLPAHARNGLLSVHIQERSSEHLWKKCLCLNEAILAKFHGQT